MGSPGKRLLGGCGLVLLLTLFAVVGVAQVGDDPRNSSDEYQDAVNGASCYAHHGGEGFRPFDYSFAPAYSQLPIGEIVVIQVRVRYPESPPSMKNAQETVQDIAVLLNTSAAPNIQVITDDLPDPLQETITLQLAHAERFEQAFQIFSGATDGYVEARLTGFDPWPLDPEQAADPGSWTMSFAGSELTGDGVTRRLDIDRDFIRARGPGNWTLSAVWNSPFSFIPAQRPFPEVAYFEVDLVMNYAAEGTEFVFPGPGSAMVRAGSPPMLIPIRVRMTSEDPALLDFRVQGVAFWAHQPTDQAPLDEGLFYRFMTMNLIGGDELVEGQSVVGPLPGASVNLYNLLTRLLGMIGLFLVLVTMVTGGVFGRSTRRFMNKITGGAKKRVLWHSAAGFLIIIVATIHFLVALLDAKNDISKGLFWGGVAWTLLVSLGFSGYYQVRIIKRWNYRIWRHLHLWSAVGVLLFLIVHTVLDGSDFAFMRDVLPGWYERLIWPRPTTGGGMA